MADPKIVTIDGVEYDANSFNEQQALITNLTARLDTQADQIKALQGAK